MWEKLVRELEKSILEDLETKKTLKHLWYVPESNAKKGRYNGIVFLGINSGGTDIRDRDVFESFNENDGLSYYHNEIWKGEEVPGTAKLQLQIRLLYIYLYKRFKNQNFRYNLEISKLENLKKIESEEDFITFSRGILAGNLCPFQSSCVENLLYPWSIQKKHLKKFWENILFNKLRNETVLIVTMGNGVVDILKNIYSISTKEFAEYPSGWGKTKIGMYKTDRENVPSIINLPHLSRCSIFGRKESLLNVEEIFSKVDFENG